LKTIRKHEGVHAHKPHCRKRIAEVEIYTSAPFTTEECLLIDELRCDDIGTEQKAGKKRFSKGAKWVMLCRPSYADYFTNFPPLKDLRIHFGKEYGLRCLEDKDFLVQWEDIAPLVVNWSAAKVKATAQLLLSELNTNAEEMCVRIPCFIVHFHCFSRSFDLPVLTCH